LGVGTLDSQLKFTFIEKMRNKNVEKVLAGGFHSWFMLNQN